MWYNWALFGYNVVTPYLKNKFGTSLLLILSFVLSFFLGFKFISNNYLDAQRVVNFYPFYLIGIWLKENKATYISQSSKSTRRCWRFLFFSLMVLYLFSVYCFPGCCYETGFMNSHGLSIFGLIARWLTYAINILLSIGFIMIMPNRKIWFTRFGTRTMNVYMLHMSLIFPLCWCALTSYNA